MDRDVSFLDNRAKDGYWYAYYTVNSSALDGKPGVDARRAKDVLGPWSDPLPCRTHGFFGLVNRIRGLIERCKSVNYVVSRSSDKD